MGAAFTRMRSAVLDRMGSACLSLTGRYVLQALFRTLHVERTGHHVLPRLEKEGTPVIFVFWHGRLLPLVHAHRRKGTAVLVSEHGDGEYIARIIQRYGFQTVRGSSTRGRVRGLRGLIRAARRGHDLAVTPDGPRGPNRSVKAGALIVARLTGLPVIPVGVAGMDNHRRIFCKALNGLVQIPAPRYDLELPGVRIRCQ